MFSLTSLPFCIFLLDLCEVQHLDGKRALNIALCARERFYYSTWSWADGGLRLNNVEKRWIRYQNSLNSVLKNSISGWDLLDKITKIHLRQRLNRLKMIKYDIVLIYLLTYLFAQHKAHSYICGIPQLVTILCARENITK